MKKLLLLSALLIFGFGFSQSDEYIELDRNWAYSQWKEFRDSKTEAGKKFTKIFKDSDEVFSYGLEITGNYTQESKDKFNQYHRYYFNSSGFIQKIELIRPYSNEVWVDTKFAFKHLPVSSKKNDFKKTGVKKNDIYVFESITYERLDWTVDNVNHKVDLSIMIANLPSYNKSKTRVTRKNKYIITTKRARTKGVNYSDVSTTFGDGIDLMDESMLYKIDEYVFAFLLDVGAPQVFNTRYLTNTELKIPELNEKDRLFLFDIGAGTRENIKVEFKDLPENTIAVAVGNVFETGLFHMIIDPIKFREASAPKRAFIVWHEGYHCLGLDHGQCGKIMFPYADKDYTWKEWNEAREEAIECWTEKRNLLSESDIKIEDSLNSSNEYFDRAFEKEKNNDLEGAIADYTRAIELDPSFVEAYNNRGLIKGWGLGDYNAGIIDLTKALKINPDFYLSYYNRGKFKGATENYRGAIADFTKGIELNPNTECYNMRALTKVKLEDYKGAISDYTKIIELVPNNVDAFYQRANTKGILKDFNGSIADIKTAIDIISRMDPTSIEEGQRGLAMMSVKFYNLMGIAKVSLEDYEGALDEYTKVIEIDPSNSAAWAGKALSKMGLGDYSGACNDAKMAERLGEDVNDYISLLCN